MKKKTDLAIFALGVSVLALATPIRSCVVSTQSYNLSVERDLREQKAKQPAIDVRISPTMNPTDVFVEIEITNRADLNIAPQNISISAPIGVAFTVDGPIVVGRTGIGAAPPVTVPNFDLLSMGTLRPGKSATIKLRASAKEPPFPYGMEVEFGVTIRFADDEDTVKAFRVIRRISFA